MPIAATPLRQVMSKSIQRAIREHVGTERYTKSPLDLRMSPVVRRSSIENHSPSKRISDKLTKVMMDENRTPEMAKSNRKRRSIELRSGSVLETVYETAKATDIADDCENQNDTNNRIEAYPKEKTVATNKSNAIGESVNFLSTETPVGGAINTNDNDDGHEYVDVWYTPCEIPMKKIENSEVIGNASDNSPIHWTNESLLYSFYHYYPH